MSPIARVRILLPALAVLLACLAHAEVAKLENKLVKLY